MILGGAIWVAVAKARIKEGQGNGEDVEYVAVELEDTNRGNRSDEFEVGDQGDEDRQILSPDKVTSEQKCVTR